MTVKEVLVGMRQLLDKPENWTQRAFARDHREVGVSAWSLFACKFCLMGASFKVANSLPRAHATTLYLANLVEDAIADWQDNPARTHAEILQLLDKAIANAN